MRKNYCNETLKIAFLYISDHHELLLFWLEAGKSTCDLLAEEELFSLEGCLAVSRIVTWRENAVWRDVVSFIGTAVILHCIVVDLIRMLARAHPPQDLNWRLL